MTRPPFPALKTPLALLLLALALSIAGIIWSTRLAADAQRELHAQQVTLKSAQAQLQRGKTEQQLISGHLPAYQAWAARGFVGAENRLAWLEAAQTANRSSGLYGLDYALAPRAPAPAALAGGLPLGMSAMTLKLPLLVETDLPRFLDALHARSSGLFRVHHCQLTRLGDTPPQAVDRPELEAECELHWFTVTPSPTETP